MRVVGIDPGLEGALACLDEKGQLIGVADMPHADGRVMGGELADILRDWLSTKPPAPVGLRVCHVRIEQGQSMPKQGVASSFKFGRACGVVEAMPEALGVPSSMVTGAVWKPRMGVTADKKSSLAKAQRLWPEHRDVFKRVKDHGRAEAALIALDYLRTVGYGGLPGWGVVGVGPPLAAS